MSTDAMLRDLAAAPAMRPAPRVGDRLGDRYVIDALLGEGGMGTVYRALDEKLGELVALKLVRAADDKLRDEVRLAQRVTHPNVCRTFDLEDVDGHQLVKMEYVAGETLATRLQRDGRLPIGEVVRIARAIAEGLSAAHAKDIVHGDLKPANVMLDGERVVLMDFGIARHVAAPVDGIRGTTGYIAPELARDRAADARADHYALGCVIYEMLAGDRVSDPDVRTRRADTPRWLARACAALLATQPTARSTGIAALHAGPRFRARIAVLVAAVAIAAVVTWRLTQRAPEWVAHVHDYPSFEENGDVVSLSPDGEWLAFSSDRHEREHWQGYVMSRSTGATTLLGSDDAAGLRWTRDGRALLYVTNHGQGGHIYRRGITGVPPRFVDASEDLGPGDGGDDCGDAVLVVVRGIGRWTVELRASDGTRRVLFSTTGNDAISSARCDSRGEHIAIAAGPAYEGGGNDIYLVDRVGVVRRITSDHRWGAAVFTPDDRGLIASGKDGERLQPFELSLAGAVIRQLVTDAGPDTQVDVSRDGRFVAFMRDTTSFLPTVTTATDTMAITHERGTYWFVREVDRNTVVAQRTQGGPADVVTLKLDDGRTEVLAHGTSPFPSRDGATIYFARVAALQSIPISGGTISPVATLPGPIKFGNAGPDGLHVIVQIADRLAGYRIVGHDVEPEGDGLVSLAAVGGWRAITRMTAGGLALNANLALVAPDGRVSRRLDVSSVTNNWLDDHSIGYCLRDHCEIYDVVLDKVVATLRLASPPGLLATIAADRTRVFESVTTGTVSRHIITNFDQR